MQRVVWVVPIIVYLHTLYLTTRGCNKQQKFMCLLMTNLDVRHFLVVPSRHGRMQHKPKHSSFVCLNI